MKSQEHPGFSFKPRINITLCIDEEMIDNALKKMEEANPNLVEVVFCKDCEYNRGEKKCLHPSSIIMVPADYDYCSYGKPRQSDDE